MGLQKVDPFQWVKRTIPICWFVPLEPIPFLDTPKNCNLATQKKTPDFGDFSTFKDSIGYPFWTPNIISYRAPPQADLSELIANLHDEYNYSDPADQCIVGISSVVFIYTV